MKLLVFCLMLAFAQAQVPPFGTNSPCTNCPIYVNSLTNDPMLYFVAERLIPFDPNYQLNAWQWYVRPETNALKVYDSNGVHLVQFDEANGETHHHIGSMWNIQPKASNQTVAVIDRNQHGRWVSSVVGSVSGDGTNMAGIGRDIKLRRYETPSHGNIEVTLQINRAVGDGASVINLSFGYTSSRKPTNVVEAMRDASNVVFTLAALNGSGSYTNARDWLCMEQLPNAICVTAIAKGGEIFGFHGLTNMVGAAGRRCPVDDAEFGVWIDPVVTLTDDDVYGEDRAMSSQTGTSLASPLVAGVAAHLREAYPAETAPEIVARIYVGMEELGSAWTLYGVKRLNAYRSLIWTRTPRLFIDPVTVSASCGLGSNAVVEASSDLVIWLEVTNIVGTGFPSPVASVSTNGNKFFRIRHLEI